MAENNEGRRNRRRNILAQYYNLPAEPENPPSDSNNNNLALSPDPRATYGTAAQSTLDPLDIENRGFDPDRYFSHLLKSETFAGILEKNKSMKEEITTLDNKMKTLVYENYSRFIAATETIKVMKTNVENMEGEMNRLSQNMTTITNCSNHIDSTLSSRREKIEKLTQVNNLLKKLQFLVDLPTKLKQSIDAEAYSTAVKYYQATASILQRYKYLPTFQQIEKESSQIMKNLQKDLDEKIKRTDLPTVHVKEYTRLLIELGEDREKLRGEFLKGRKSELQKLIDSFSLGEKSLQQALTEFNQHFLPAFVNYVRFFADLFLNPDVIHTSTEKKTVEKLLEDFIQDIMNNFLNVTKNATLEIEDMIDVLRGLEVLTKALNETSVELAQFSRHSKISSAQDVSTNIVQAHISSQFKNLQEKTPTMLEKMKDDIGTPGICKTTSNSIVTEISSVLNKLRVFFQSKDNIDFLANKRQGFMMKIYVKIQGYFLSLTDIAAKYLKEVTINPNAKETESKESNLSIKFILMVARVYQYLENQGIARVRDILLKFIEQTKMKETENMINAPELRVLITESKHKLVGHYVKLKSQKLSHMVWKCMETPNWLAYKEPTTPRSVLSLIVDQIQEVKKEVVSIIESDSVQKGHFRHSSTSKPIFTKFRMSREINCDREEILGEIVKIILKSFIEFIRMKTFSKFGFQQLQVDAHLLKYLLATILDSKSSDFFFVPILLSEIVDSAKDRCIEPIPLGDTVVRHICSSTIQELKLLDSF